MKDFLLSYDNVCLRPRFSMLESRAQADTSINFLGRRFRLPVVPANMRDVIDWKLAWSLAENGYFYIMHRFDGANSKMTHQVKEIAPFRSISVGVNGESRIELENYKKDNVRLEFITIDVAHAHHDSVGSMVKFVREVYPESKLIVGNVATKQGVMYLYRLGVDAIKVGIGGGSICTTKFKTGFHLPTLQSVYEANEFMEELDAQGLPTIPIISDGGAKHYGDIAKALTMGASMVMSGGWFASCIDSPAKFVDGKKLYRGSTSYEMKGEFRHIEGRTLTLDEGLTYGDRFEEIRQALQSSISYAGGNDLSAFEKVEWERIDS